MPVKDFKEKLKRLERLSLDPFNPEPLREALEDILKKAPELSKEEQKELAVFLQDLKKRIEENYNLCFGWMEEVLKRGFRREV